ncbi:uncharacterized protein LOC143535709 [Bidens hawaiensis]|uniref:uncharacterized protein LOC143535709 n=1 Tax=Bidens hawaiensis TaxID=980011 RepID=UPI00404AE099
MAKDKSVLNLVGSNPHISAKTIQEEVSRKYELNASRPKAFKAKVKASKEIRGDYKEQYSKLRDYAMELMNANPGTTVKIDVESEPNPSSQTRVFKRIYICLGPLKQGFKACGRELLGLDGAFLKGSYQGQVLVAVGLDPNNGIYPLAYAIAEAENKSSWTWFLECLQDDLDLQSNSNFTFISDRQKGLIPALAQVFPAAEHRFCLRHIHQNMKLKWRGKAFKDCLWACATATTVPDFIEQMEELKKFNIEAYKWLAGIPPQHWSRSHFTGRAQSDVLLNNMCEVLNSKTVDGREKPIISCLEFIREYLMKRIINVMKAQDKWNGPLTPKATIILERNKKNAPSCIVKWCGDKRWQVTGTRGDWELSGIPCKHVVAVNWDMVVHKQEVGPLETWVNPCYFMDTWKEVYKYKIGPLNGPKLWPKCQVPTTLIAPFHRAQIGRPRKNRRKDQVELEDNMEVAGKLTRKGGTVTCKMCGDKGHNSRGCGKHKNVAGDGGESVGQTATDMDCDDSVLGALLGDDGAAPAS